jgi:hypothetical protein
MAALVEGLGGVRNEGLAFDKVKFSPRWTSAGVDSVNVTIKLSASNGYVAYKYLHNAAKKKIDIKITGSGKEINSHILLPRKCEGVASVLVDGQPVNYNLSQIENSYYTDFKLSLPIVHNITINYK